MTPPPDFQSLLDALSEPALVLHTSGAIKRANLAASSLLGKGVEGRNLIELETEDRERLRLYLRRCSGSRQRTIRKMSLRGEDGVVRSLRCKGCLLRPANGAPGSALLFINYAESDDRFSILARQIRDLNAEMHKRSYLQAVLEQSLRRHDLLMRELHHRVGNNLQMISGMLSAARSELESPEARSALTRASQRIGQLPRLSRFFAIWRSQRRFWQAM
jgi:two-component sensor histidine kinase